MNGFICQTINKMSILDKRLCVLIIVSFGSILLHIASSLDNLASKRFQQFSKSMRKMRKMKISKSICYTFQTAMIYAVFLCLH